MARRMTSYGETQFSIYKISYDAAQSHLTLDKDPKDSEYADCIVKKLIANIVQSLYAKHKNAIYNRVTYKGFCGIVFKTTHEPSWQSVARIMLDNNEYPEEQKVVFSATTLTNTNVSYVFFYICNGLVYAVTGGYGSNYISKFTDKNYGLYLLPKVIKRDNPVVKSLTQNNLLGNQTASQRTNKNTTSINIEQDMSSVFRQLSIEADRDLAELFGVSFDDDESANKKITILNKDSIVIHRSMSLVDLKCLIQQLNSLETIEDQFALNYLVPATKKNIKNADLLEKLVSDILIGEHSSFIVAGDDYTRFYTGVDRYLLTDEITGEVLINKEEPILFSDIVAALPRAKDGTLTKTGIKTALKKWTISGNDNSGQPVLFPLCILDSIQGYIEYGEKNIPCYLFNGSWYVFDEKFGDSLSKEYTELYKQNQSFSNSLIKEFTLSSNSGTEEAYNRSLYNNAQVIVAHTVLVDNVEIADAIFWNEDTLFLMHNKGKFSGIGARDVVNQALTSAEFFQRHRALHSREAFFEMYFNKIQSKYNSKKLSMPFSKEQFVEKMCNLPNVNYVIGYIDGFKENSRTTYAKYLTIDVTKKLATKGYRCTIVNTKG